MYVPSYRLQKILMVIMLILPVLTYPASAHLGTPYLQSLDPNDILHLESSQGSIYPVDIEDPDYASTGEDNPFPDVGNYDDVLLIINDNSAISQQIASYFMSQRPILPSQVCHVTAPTSETVTRAQFNTIRAQIESFITTNGLTDKINYIVTTKGLPLRVTDSNTDRRACVDSELALILGPYSGYINQTYWLENPLFGLEEEITHETHGIYMVTRFTGYDYNDIKGMIDLATAAPGQRGTFILDMDPGRDSGGYKMGNDWMRSADNILTAKGYDTVLDFTNEFLGDQQDIGGYTSWGSNDGHYASNWISNGGFETDSDSDGVPNGWEIINDTGYGLGERNATDFDAGSWSVRLERTGAGGNFTGLFQNHSAANNIRFYAYASANLSGVSSPGGVHIQFRAYSASNQLLAVYNGSARTGTTSDWVSLAQTSYEPLPNVAYFRVGVVLKSQGTVFVDSIGLREIRPHNTWVPGAIAETYVSTGGRTFNYPPSYGQSLVADLVREGVSGVKGYVYEPYLSACAHPDILFDRYTEGYTLAECYYMASQLIGWMGVVVGDPKLNPYIDELPDLVLDDVTTTPDEPNEGDEVKISASITNAGGRPVAEPVVKFYMDGSIIASKTLDELGPNQDTSVDATINTTGISGQVNISVVVDPMGEERESDEDNNAMNGSVTINGRATVTDITVPFSSMPRGQECQLEITGIDPEDPMDLLIVNLEYKTPEGDWYPINQMGTDIALVGDHWEASFIPAYSSSLGIYRFRASLTDSFDLAGHLFMEPSQLLVENNPPVVDLLSVDEESVLRGDPITIDVFGGDPETGDEQMTCEVQVRFGSSEWSDLEYCNWSGDNWQAEFVPGSDGPKGNHSIRARLVDDELLPGRSDWVLYENNILVENNLPSIEDMWLLAGSVRRTERFTVFIRALDREDPPNTLDVNIELSGIEVDSWSPLDPVDSNFNTENGTHVLVFETTHDWIPGPYALRASATDLEHLSSQWNTCVRGLDVLNNIPVIEEVRFKEGALFRMDPLGITIKGEDVEDDDDELVCQVQFRTNGGSWTPLPTSYGLGSWSTLFTPPVDATLGRCSLRVRLLDKENTGETIESLITWTEITDLIEVVNNPPEASGITVVARGQEGGMVTATMMGSDTEDAPEGLMCVFQYMALNGSWVTVECSFIEEVTQGKGSWSATLDPDTFAKPDIYSFRVMFKDRDGAASQWLQEDIFIDKGIGEGSTFLFTLDQELAKYLTEAEVNDALVLAFSEKGVSLSSGATISKTDEGHWRITDGDTVYRLEDTGSGLNVYTEDIEAEGRDGGASQSPLSTYSAMAITLIVLVVIVAVFFWKKKMGSKRGIGTGASVQTPVPVPYPPPKVQPTPVPAGEAKHVITPIPQAVLTPSVAVKDDDAIKLSTIPDDRLLPSGSYPEKDEGTHLEPVVDYDLSLED